MEHLSIVLTNYIFKRDLLIKKLRNIPIWFQCFLEVSASTICSIVIALLLHMFSECLFFFLLFIPMRSFSGGLHLKPIFLFYRLLLDTNYYPAYCEIPYYLDSYFLLCCTCFVPL